MSNLFMDINMSKFYYLTLLFVFLFFNTQAQECNGFFKEDVGGGYTHHFYKKECKKHGVFKAFKDNQLMVFGEYDEGEKVGDWYYFDKNGYLNFKIEIKECNKKKDGEMWYRGFFIEFDNLGRKISEGHASFEDPEVDIIPENDWKTIEY